MPDFKKYPVIAQGNYRVFLVSVMYLFFRRDIVVIYSAGIAVFHGVALALPGGPFIPRNRLCHIFFNDNARLLKPVCKVELRVSVTVSSSTLRIKE